MLNAACRQLPAVPDNCSRESEQALLQGPDSRFFQKPSSFLTRQTMYDRVWSAV